MSRDGRYGEVPWRPSSCSGGRGWRESCFAVKPFDPGELLARVRVHFELLRETSQRIHRKVRDIADEIVLTGELLT